MQQGVVLLPGPPASTLERAQKGVCADETNVGVCIVIVCFISCSVVKVCILRLSVRLILVVFVFAFISVVIVILCYGRPEFRLDGIEEIQHAFLGTLSLSCTVFFIATTQENFN